ncbi:MAG: response regulator transcription factor [Lachnospiraceae bacterium]|nr:response regulator transcription factor [Lachnospiraceae bacterium]
MFNALIVEDSRVSRESFERELETIENCRLAASIENAANAVIACMKGDIDLVLMDVCTADNESGLTAAAQIKKYSPGIKVIIMTSMPEYSFLERAREAGCDSFWYKETDEIPLAEVITRTLEGDRVWPESEPEVYIGLVSAGEFTKRELEVMRALTAGHRYEEIAEEMDISVNTVKYHVKSILQKTGFRSTVQLVAEVVEKRLILPKY